MPLDAEAKTVVTALTHTPTAAHGLVRDLRVRWALEEIGRPYRTELFEWNQPRPQGYDQWQPFGQVPALDDGEVRMFESGAILLHLGEQDERLLPREPQARADAYSWLIAALNSLEPAIFNYQWTGVFHASEAWSKEALPGMVEFLRKRLAHVEQALGTDQWLAGPFSVADIVMVTVLRPLGRTDILGTYPKLTAYKQRGEARPAFVQALADQLAGLGEPTRQGEPA